MLKLANLLFLIIKLMKRIKTPRIIPPRLKLRKSSPDFSLGTILGVNSIKKSNENINEATLPRSNSFNYSPAHFEKMRNLIRVLEDENKKLHQENFRVKEENNNLNKVNKELQTKGSEQQKYIARLCGEVSKLNESLCKASNDLNRGKKTRANKFMSRDNLKRRDQIFRAGSLNCIAKKSEMM